MQKFIGKMLLLLLGILIFIAVYKKKDMNLTPEQKAEIAREQAIQDRAAGYGGIAAVGGF